MPDSRPTFSIVLETANLSQQAELSGLFDVLEALESQTPHPRHANECLLVQCGAVSDEVVQQICARYPWVTAVQAPSSTGYYASKMVGARRATGDVVVVCDSDCRYGDGWLSALLEPFRDPQVHVVAGNTGLAMTGPFSFGLGLIWPFPMYSRGAKRGIITFYAANNVAFRRDTLLAYPLPPDTPVYRGNCAVQSNRMRQAGLRIHFAQAARSLHPPPATGFTTFFWRFLISGHDWLIWHRLSPGHRTGVAGLWQDVVVFVRTALRWAVRPFVKIPMLVREAPIRALWLPIALPLAAVAWVLFCVGFVVTLFRPNAIIAAGTPHMEH